MARQGGHEQAVVLGQAVITRSEGACMQAEISVLFHTPNLTLEPPLPPKSKFNY